jgi:hypothetical protein
MKTNRKLAATLFAIVAPLALMGSNSGCNDRDAKFRQADIAKRAADSISFTENVEIDNIKKRIELTAQPGLLGFILLMNEAGQPILYEGVKGKVTSGGKRLTQPDRLVGSDRVMAAPSDEGTWGSSAEYIFYWNQNGEYRQYSGKYLYSDKPFRLRIEPLVVSVQAPVATSKQ